jgi:hypothetical protein
MFQRCLLRLVSGQAHQYLHQVKTYPGQSCGSATIFPDPALASIRIQQALKIKFVRLTLIVLQAENKLHFVKKKPSNYLIL